MYPWHAMLLNFSVKSRQNITCNEHTLVRLLLAEYDKDSSTAQRIDVQECTGNITIGKTCRLIPFKKFFARKTVSKGREEEIVEHIVRI